MRTRWIRLRIRACAETRSESDRTDDRVDPFSINVTDFYYRASTLYILNHRRTMTGTARVMLEDPQRDPFPFPSLPTPRLRLLQTVDRPILYIFCLSSHHLFPLFRGVRATTTCPPPTKITEKLDGGNTYDLECVEIWERFARNDQFRYCPCRFDVLGVMVVMGNDGEFSEPWTRSHKS